MDEIERYFIATIVGSPQRHVLGRQVRFDLDPTLALPRASKGLASGRIAIKRLVQRVQEAIAFLGETTRSTREKARAQVAAPVGKRSLTPIGYVAWAAPTVLISAVLLYMGISWYEEFELSKGGQVASTIAPKPTVAASEVVASEAAASESQGLPLEPATAQSVAGTGVTVVDAPAPTDPGPATILQREGLPLDRKVPTVVLTPAPAPTPSANSAAALQPTKSVPAERPKEERVDRSVVVDVTKNPDERRAEPIVTPKEEERAATRKFAPPTEVKAVQASSTPQQPTKTESAQSNALKPKADHITVVDIAPDASYVLITNPQTRLPQRYTSGQKIFTGETIKSIDPKAGQLVLDSRTVNME